VKATPRSWKSENGSGRYDGVLMIAGMSNGVVGVGERSSVLGLGLEGDA
jgi:hypothetical protein